MTTMPPGFYKARVEDARALQRGVEIHMRLESGESIREVLRVERVSLNSSHYLWLRRDQLQHQRRVSGHWRGKVGSDSRRQNARGFLAFFLFFPGQGEARVLLEAQLYALAEAARTGRCCSNCGEDWSDHGPFGTCPKLHSGR